MAEEKQKEDEGLILVVEDEKALREVLIDKFTREGMKVVAAKDGEEGLKMAKELHPDLILLDIVMPRMDGIAVLDKLREDKWGKTAKVVFLTNLDDTNRVSRAMQNDAFEYLIKSDWKLEEVVKKVKKKIWYV